MTSQFRKSFIRLDILDLRAKRRRRKARSVSSLKLIEFCHKKKKIQKNFTQNSGRPKSQYSHFGVSKHTLTIQ